MFSVNLFTNIMTNTNKIEFRINTESLISLIEKRRCIWDTSNEHYKNRDFKQKAFEYVTSMVVPNYRYLSQTQKEEACHDVQKRWNNLRTCFRREINAQKNMKSGQTSSKKRKYIYFNELLFLMPYIMDNNQTETNMGLAEYLNDDDDVSSEVDIKPEPLINMSTPVVSPYRKRTLESRSALDTDDKTSIEALKGIKDEDTNFALSIVPSLQTLTPEEKLDAKINILRVFKHILAKRHNHNDSSHNLTPKQDITS